MNLLAEFVRLSLSQHFLVDASIVQYYTALRAGAWLHSILLRAGVATMNKAIIPNNSMIRGALFK